MGLLFLGAEDTYTGGGLGNKKENHGLPFISMFNRQEKKINLKKPEKFEGKAVWSRLSFPNPAGRKEGMTSKRQTSEA